MKFAADLNQKIEDSAVAITCDAGSVGAVGQSESQIGVVAAMQPKGAKVIYTEDNFRLPDGKGARKAVGRQPRIKSAPTFRPPGKSESVAVSSSQRN